MIEVIKPQMPLTIAFADWDDAILKIYGDTWKFNSLCAWRLQTSDKVLCGCYDDDAREVVLSLNGLKITEIKCQDRNLKIDPVFVLSNGQFLEIFSTDTCEPWTFSIGETDIFVATPSEPNDFNVNRF